jgi:AcrR family transcriptional regulator
MATTAAGRPRSEQSRRAILSAAYEAMADSGFAALSIEGIARRAGASKATVYRWWPNKAAVVLEAVQEHTHGYPRFRHSGDTRADLIDELRGVVRFYASPAGGALLDLIAQSRFDPDLAQALRDRFIMARRAETTEVLRAGVASGQLRADLDVEVTMDAIWGSIYYKLLVSHTPLSAGYANDLVTTFWAALAASQR